MAVNATHSEYDKLLAQWSRCRDSASGEEAVHSAGVRYLPRLKDQTDTDYEAYKLRASFFNATWRTISGLRGMLFRKPPKVEIPASVEPLLDAVSGDGQPFSTFVTEVTQECLITGRTGIIVDFPVANLEGTTQADSLRMNLRPTLAMYRAEAIINWREDVINNRRVLSRVILKETASEQDPNDEFSVCEEDRYRVLDLFNGVYRVRIFRPAKNHEGQFEQVGEDLFPMMNNQPMVEIPFFFLGTDDTEVCPDEPPLIDLVDLNLSHYRTTADFEHGCHFTGLPTAYVCGYSDGDDVEIYLGSQSILIFPDPNTKVGFLEFTGAGLSMLENNLTRKETQMALLGARMLQAPKRAVESADTVTLNRVGENSLLADIAQSISRGISRALQVFSDWAGGSGEVVFTINRDFFPMPMDPQKLTALVAAWQSGAISKESLFENLQQSEIISDDTTFEDEEAKISNSMPLVQ